MEGILFALVPMFAWGSIGFVSNKIGGKPSQQTFGMTLGALLFALVVWLVVRPEMSMKLWIFGILGGVIWSVGQTGQFHAMQYMGVSVANPLSSGSQLVLGSLIGVLVFHEWTKPIQFVVGTIALLLLIVGFYFSSKQDETNAASNQLHDFSKGFRALTYSTIGYVMYAVLFNNIMKFDVLSVILPMAVGMVLGAAMFMSFKVSFDQYVIKNSVVGLLWGVGNIFMLLAASKAGLAIAFSFSQLGAIISIVGGILFLGETKTKKEMRWVITGILCFIVGAILLGIVKS
ncbi:TPA: GRP family sugar transporter [Streptococcus equi subsp. zooepidemicus]|uniref:GRP family sugar transporter n=1 Tax=Streptococcus equi TaxID=1336 RepID=UPI001E396001|nr:GRP family sugar transporter [Streptococcus equi]MCD3376890.1 L-rhamnose-proton symporter RhaT [Streptococcus equi subsp. zooepidemicus]HEL0442281.1 GRP family sugar transporter [Streptococcus equi subsp. zooepidemicus]HEL0452595.1 GRP family sugar transporter [Streptococcus equi subsp. zooepidemicus]HEL0677752.1 GRP family sugar transporter [Streptococcus equi subsp. zooepidemicus]HEL0756685.1 GRP family sugar transporter [Streptococcus equi subsp. zooepidemicus]